MSWSTNKVVLLNYEGVITMYKEPDFYEPTFRDHDCTGGDLQLNLDDADRSQAIGVEQLLADLGQTISLISLSNARHRRRKGRGRTHDFNPRCHRNPLRRALAVRAVQPPHLSHEDRRG